MKNNSSTFQRDMVRTLLECRADPNLADGWGKTALHVHLKFSNFYATQEGTSRDSVNETTQLLLDARADVNARDDEGAAPLHHSSDRDSARMLLAAGAHPNTLDKTGKSVLHLALAAGSTDVSFLRALIAGGCDPRVGGGSETAFDTLVKYDGRLEGRDTWEFVKTIVDAGTKGVGVEWRGVKSEGKQIPEPEIWKAYHDALLRKGKDVEWLLSYLEKKGVVLEVDEQQPSKPWYLRAIDVVKEIHDGVRPVQNERSDRGSWFDV
jgi:ankyrin repeat protein